MLQRLKVTSSIALVALFLLVTAHQSNALTQSQQSNTLTNFKHGYLPNYTANSIESEQTGIKLANRWGHYKNKRKHYCERKRRGRLPQSRYCRSYRARHAAKARARMKRRMMSRLKKRNRYNFNSKSKNGRDLNSIFRSRKNSRQPKEQLKAKPVPQQRRGAQLKAKPVPQQRRGTQQTGGRKVYTNERRMAPVYTAKKERADARDFLPAYDDTVVCETTQHSDGSHANPCELSVKVYAGIPYPRQKGERGGSKCHVCDPLFMSKKSECKSITDGKIYRTNPRHGTQDVKSPVHSTNACLYSKNTGKVWPCVYGTGIALHAGQFPACTPKGYGCAKWETGEHAFGKRKCLERDAPSLELGPYGRYAPKECVPDRSNAFCNE
jgi:hypothetical protein